MLFEFVKVVIQLSDHNFQQEVLESKTPVLVDFYATWCGPCQMQSPIVDEVAEAVKETAKVCKIDVDQAQETAGKYNVMSIPTILIFSKGQVAEQMVGVQTKETLIQKIKEQS